MKMKHMKNVLCLNVVDHQVSELLIKYLLDLCTNVCSFVESVMNWIQCDGGCNKWFHMICVGLKIKEVKPDVDFICYTCKRTKAAAAGGATGLDETTTVSKKSNTVSTRASRELK